VGRLCFGAPVRIQQNLMHVSQRAHQRTREAGEIADRLKRDWKRDRRFDHEIAIAFAREIENGRLTGEHAALGGGNYRGEAGRAPSLNALVTEIHFLGRGAPRASAWAIFRSARNGLLRMLTAFACRSGYWRNAYVRK